MTGSPYIEIMVFDLGRAFRKKDEFESARLMDFEFRQRSRATKNLGSGPNNWLPLCA